MTQYDPAEKHWQTILALVLSALGMALSLFEAISVIVVGLLPSNPDSANIITTMPAGFLVWSFILSALLLLPVFLLSIYRLQRKGDPEVAGYEPTRDWQSGVVRHPGLAGGDLAGLVA